MNAAFAGADGKCDSVRVDSFYVKPGVGDGLLRGRDGVLDKGIQEVRPVRTRIKAFERKNRGKLIPFRFVRNSRKLSGNAFFKIFTELRERIPDRGQNAHSSNYHASFHVLVIPSGVQQEGILP